VAETWCVCGYKPAHCHCPPDSPPASLTPEMLSEEDRKHLESLRMFADPFVSYPCCDSEMDRFAKLRAEAFDWADRLLNTSKGG
jgi:hypothetical protein